ncbi:sulfurtransferase-like selenium metabolism protein YedF [uncultured Desulfosarcina sp.]|uniref:sulfurtransferase-like selenium metabolism protein YedF n=1 Tax=uncultured Desulfosarcina sp. TaxID=218289 RepID=UPI0029C89F24|nr:sulfurtransferase-like selenium metabolism protein YedF [uncultured Desulfosarcina sp.]
MNKIDVRGLSCPAPVLETKAAVESRHPQHLEVLVDNEPARQNVVRFLESQGYGIHVDQEGDLYTVIGTAGEAASEPTPVATASGIPDKKIMVMVAADRMGSGDDLLGAKLMINFIKTLKEMGDELWRLVFVNSGVKLTIDGAGTLEDLKGLEEAGLTLLVCGTCLDHFDLLEKKRVGQTTNMLDIVTAMQFADKVINI